MTVKIEAQSPAKSYPETILGDAVEWLRGRAKEFTWMLAHADDGVIWGAVVSGDLHTAQECGWGPKLRTTTLQQARLFGETAEILLWRDGDGTFHARTIRDCAAGDADWSQYYDERQMLLGTYAAEVGNVGGAEFTLLEHESQGLLHAIPVPLPVHKKVTPPRLMVRHYLTKTGPARVQVSRLVRLGDQ